MSAAAIKAAGRRWGNVGVRATSPHKTRAAIEVVHLRRRNPRLGQDTIQALLARRGIHLGAVTINRILHAPGLIQRRLQRRQRRHLATLEGGQLFSKNPR